MGEGWAFARELIFLWILSIFNSRKDWVLVGTAGQPAEFLSLEAAEISWSVMLVICTLSLRRMLWSDCMDVMLSTLIIRIWVMVLMASIHQGGGCCSCD